MVVPISLESLNAILPTLKFLCAYSTIFVDVVSSHLRTWWVTAAQRFVGDKFRHSN